GRFPLPLLVGEAGPQERTTGLLKADIASGDGLSSHDLDPSVPEAFIREGRDGLGIAPGTPRRPREKT
ncbi:hypothetical protein OVO43_12275, partial [Streptococcus pneumoniae]|nr:hypothetical protein [Streptococcus pneumoniae]